MEGAGGGRPQHEDGVRLHQDARALGGGDHQWVPISPINPSSKIQLFQFVRRLRKGESRCRPWRRSTWSAPPTPPSSVSCRTSPARTGRLTSLLTFTSLKVKKSPPKTFISQRMIFSLSGWEIQGNLQLSRSQEDQDSEGDQHRVHPPRVPGVLSRQPGQLPAVLQPAQVSRV